MSPGVFRVLFLCSDQKCVRPSLSWFWSPIRGFSQYVDTALPRLTYPTLSQSSLFPVLLLLLPLVTLLIILDFLLKPISCCSVAMTLFCSIFNEILLLQQHFSHVLDHNLVLPLFVLNSSNEVSGNCVSLDCIFSANWRLLN